MAKISKISDKLAKVNDNFTVYMYDNGFMLEIGGQNKKQDWATTKIMCGSVTELVDLINEAANMERD